MREPASAAAKEIAPITLTEPATARLPEDE
jgi:hypothetical protein